MTSELSEQMELARAALQNGEVQKARRMLRRIVHQESDNHRAWLWLAGVTDAPKASIQYIKRAQELAPDDPSVAAALGWANKRLLEGNSDTARLIATHKNGFMPPADTTQIAQLPDELSELAAQTPPDQVQVPSTVAEQTNTDVPNPDAVPAGFSQMVKRIGWVLVALALLVVGALMVLRMLNNRPATGDAPPVEAAPLVIIDNGMDTAQSSLRADAAQRSRQENRSQEALVIELPAMAEISAETSVLAQTDLNQTNASLAESVVENAAALSDAGAVDEAAAAQITESSQVERVETPVPRGFVQKNAVPLNEPLVQWTPTPAPATPIPTEVAVAAQPLDAYLFNEARWIDVNLTTQYLTAYENGVPVFSTYISSGLPETPTVVGQFRIYLRLESQDMNGYQIGYDYYTPNVPYVMYFHGNFAIHGAYWHNNFGNPMSHGCINTSVTDGAWLFNFAGIGTLVNVHY